MSARVALVQCGTYDLETVHQAVGRGLQLLGGAERFARPGERILLKPNLLVAAAPDNVVTTHPSVFRAVIMHLKAEGAQLAWGDSPGFGGTSGVARRAGLLQVAEELGIQQADFTCGRPVSFPDGNLVKRFTIAGAVLDADGIVSLPKMKTHGLTRITGAVKNQFGCIPGLLKGEFHARMGTVERFSQMLVDLNLLLKPRLFIMDGVVAMQGNGPRSGDPRPMSVLLLSDDPVALDTVFARLVDLDPRLVPTIVWGERRGLGSATDIEIVGDPIEGFMCSDFEVNRSPGSTTGEPGPVSRLVKDWVVPRPVIDPERCSRCGTCVSVCPVDPKAVDFPPGPTPAVAPNAGAPLPTNASRSRMHTPVHNYRRCIRCYCCQEMCPEHAIDIHTPLLGRLIHQRRRFQNPRGRSTIKA